MMLAAAGMMAPDGRCKTLDASADGYVRAEACRMLFIRRPDAPGAEHADLHAAAAEADASSLPATGRTQTAPVDPEEQPRTRLDAANVKGMPEAELSGAQQQVEYVRAPIAVLLGCGVNTNGRASALTAPHGPSQQALLRAVLGAAGLAMAEVAGLQLHANGTPLGDPIEVGAGAAVFQGQVTRRTHHRTKPRLRRHLSGTDASIPRSSGHVNPKICLRNPLPFRRQPLW